MSLMLDLGFMFPCLVTLQFLSEKLQMAPMNLFREEKSWKTENVAMKEIMRRMGRGKSTIRSLVATA